MAFQVVKQIRGTATFGGNGFAAHFADNHTLFNVFLAIPEPLPDDRASAVFPRNQVVRLHLQLTSLVTRKLAWALYFFSLSPCSLPSSLDTKIRMRAGEFSGWAGESAACCEKSTRRE